MDRVKWFEGYEGIDSDFEEGVADPLRYCYRGITSQQKECRQHGKPFTYIPASKHPKGRLSYANGPCTCDLQKLHRYQNWLLDLKRGDEVAVVYGKGHFRVTRVAQVVSDGFIFIDGKQVHNTAIITQDEKIFDSQGFSLRDPDTRGSANRSSLQPLTSHMARVHHQRAEALRKAECVGIIRSKLNHLSLKDLEAMVALIERK